MNENPKNDAAIRKALDLGYISVHPQTGKIWSHRVAGGWRKEPKLLSTKPKKNGYLRTTVTVCGKEHTVFHHRIVWITVNGHIPAGMTVDHRNGKKTNNRIGNLRLKTKGDNVRAAFSQGLRRGKVLSSAEEQEIRSLYRAGGVSQDRLARRFGCSQSQISRVLVGRR